MGGIAVEKDRNPLVEHPNRGKRSVGIDLSTAEGQAVLYEIAKTADVFLTNYLPSVWQKHKFDIEHIRAANPNIIYARGRAYGDKGPERDDRTSVVSGKSVSVRVDLGGRRKITTKNK